MKITLRRVSLDVCKHCSSPFYGLDRKNGDFLFAKAFVSVDRDGFALDGREAPLQNRRYQG